MYVVHCRLVVVEDAVPGKHLSEMEEKRQELIGVLFGVFYSTLAFIISHLILLVMLFSYHRSQH